MESIAPTAVITRVGSHQRAYAAPNTYIRVRVAGLGMGQVRYVTDDGYLGVHFAGDPPARVDEVRRDLLTAISIGGPVLLAQLLAAVRPALAESPRANERQPIPVMRPWDGAGCTLIGIGRSIVMGSLAPGDRPCTGCHQDRSVCGGDPVAE